LNEVANCSSLGSEPEPELGLGLLIAMRDVSRGVENHGIGPRIVAEAEAALRFYDNACEPVTQEHFRKWMAPVVGSVGNAPQGRELGVKITSLFFVVSNLPRGAFTAETLQDGMRCWKYWPSGKEVYDAVSGKAYELESQRRKLIAVIKAGCKPPKPNPRKDDPINPARSLVEECVAALRARNAELVEECVAALRARNAELSGKCVSHESPLETPRTRPAKPGHLRDELLLKRYRQFAINGDKLAAARAEALERKLNQSIDW
jgi:hypothetical protein